MTRSRKIIITLGILLSLAASLYLYFNHMVKEIDATVKPMITQIVASNWDRNVLDRYSTEALKQWSQENNEDYESMLRQFRRLGFIKNYKGITRFHYKKTSNQTSIETAVLIDFEEAPVTLDLLLIEENGKWAIQTFYLEKN